jgi:hypothetical protein
VKETPWNASVAGGPDRMAELRLLVYAAPPALSGLSTASTGSRVTSPKRCAAARPACISVPAFTSCMSGAVR